jgi:hypothetical protein
MRSEDEDRMQDARMREGCEMEDGIEMDSDGR